eukprot:EG_transcript_20991
MGAEELAELQRALEGIDFRDVEAVEIDSKTTVRRELHVLPRTAGVDPAAAPLTAHEWVPSLGPLLDREDAAPETRSVFVKLHLAMTGRRWGVETAEGKQAWLQTAADYFEQGRQPLTAAALWGPCHAWLQSRETEVEEVAEVCSPCQRVSSAGFTASAEPFMAAFQACTAEAWLYPWSDTPFGSDDEQELAFAVAGPLKSRADRVVVAAFCFNCWM